MKRKFKKLGDMRNQLMDSKMLRFSFKKKNISIKISPKNYKLIIIPPKNFFMFRGVAKNSIIINSIQQLHDPKESIKSPYKKNEK